MIVYSPSITHRLRFSADFIGRELLGKPLELTDNQDVFAADPGPRICYAVNRPSVDAFHIIPQGLLEEQGIRQQETRCFDAGGFKAFFATAGDFSFDVFAAVFYLLSRYEEYLPHQKDLYGRYAHEQSLAYREKFLDQPLVNTWLQALKKKLQERYPAYPFVQKQYAFLPTYDIDEAWSYKYKQWWRSAGAALKDIASGKFDRFSLRRKVLDNKMPDPYDSFSWIDDLHRPHALHPRYFFLVAHKNGKYDKHILPTETAMQTLIKRMAEKYPIGIHPSWQSGDDPSLVGKEIAALTHISGLKVIASRQHYIRLTLPQTFRHLIDAGIKEDFSMGYGSINGFRASVASPFYWYDLEKEETTYLRLFPFCYMEANSFFEQGMSATEALEEMRHYHRVVKAVQGTLITIWHNTFLGTEKRFAGWREAYATFFKEALH